MNTITRLFDFLDTTERPQGEVEVRAGVFLILSLLVFFSTLYVPAVFALATIPLGLYFALGAIIALADLNLRV